MESRNQVRKAWLAAAATLFLLAGGAPASAQTNTKGELKCHAALTKAIGKNVAAVAKAMAACRTRVIDGAAMACPDATADAAIDKAGVKVSKAVAKKCQSRCSVSGLGCIDNLFCPPNGTQPESCTQAGKNPFHANRMSVPGPFCEAIIAQEIGGEGKMIDADRWAICAIGLSELIAEDFIDNIFGSLDETATLDSEASKCISGLAKAAPKAAFKLANTVSKCRVKQLGQATPPFQPENCVTADEKTAAKVSSDTTKFLDAVEKSCTPAAITQLDLCGQGVGTVVGVAGAQACLGDLLVEASYSIEDQDQRDFVNASIINAAYPATAAPRCGDGLVNQGASQFFLLGEECDGDDDSACPGECLPPGDLFQCTCGNIPRLRTLADGFGADLDNGWSGTSHNAAVTNRAGFITSVANCDCDEFHPVDKATCIGNSGDSVCDVFGYTHPRCSGNPDGGTSCDQDGNNNGVNNDADCQVCDDFSDNAGAFCNNEGDCQSRCYDGDTPTDSCTKQSDCPEGQLCRGRCDKTQTCIIMRNGAPLPLSAGGTAVCLDSQFHTNVTGTRNIVTGEHAVNYELRSVTYLGDSFARPCPACGGFCTGPGSYTGERCDGTCTGPETECRAGANAGVACVDDTDCPGSFCHGVACRFDDDCPSGTCGTASPECLGEACNLDLVCVGGINAGKSCRIESVTAFGTTSRDCPPLVGLNLSGNGLSIKWTPLTSETVSHTGLDGLSAPCDAPGFQNFDCECVTGGGTIRSQPNRCSPACTAGPNYGASCSNNTVCVGGTEQGVACDEDSDCSGVGATCSGNPGTCTGGSNDGTACRIGIDTPCLGGGTCGNDVCPTGICSPLCVEKGTCIGGANAGRFCATDLGCPGGTCGNQDPEEGVCAGGPSFNHCDGPGQTFRTCTPAQVGTQGGCEAGVDGDINTLEDNYLGAGNCIADVRNCFVNGGLAQGGDIYNGKGDPTNIYSVSAYCIGHLVLSPSVNATSGLPGPGRIRQPALAVPNFTELLP
jgi:hypothetical protein